MCTFRLSKTHRRVLSWVRSPSPRSFGPKTKWIFFFEDSCFSLGAPTEHSVTTQWVGPLTKSPRLGSIPWKPSVLRTHFNPWPDYWKLKRRTEVPGYKDGEPENEHVRTCIKYWVGVVVKWIRVGLDVIGPRREKRVEVTPCKQNEYLR